jgi:SOS-response transcriptional repressor LexA
MIVAAYKPEHIRAAIFKRGMTLREVAKRAGMEPPQLSRILNADGDLHVSTLDKIAEAIPCDPGEFFGGKSKSAQGKADPIVVFPRTQAERDRLLGDERPEQFEAIPLLADRASLGPGLEIEDAKLNGYCLIYRPWLDKGGKHYAVQVAGNSMSPILSDGDIVAINVNAKSPSSLKGKLVAARAGDGVTIKEFRIRGDHWYFAALNPEWEQEHGQLLVKPKDSIILGKVVWAWKKLG